MTRVRVVGIALDDPELLKLLHAAGCEVVIDGLDPVEEDEEDPVEEVETDDGLVLAEPEEVGVGDNDNCADVEALIVVLSEDCPEENELKALVMKAVGAGAKVIGIWPRNCEVGQVPEAVDRLGDDTLVWDPAILQQAIGSHNPQWQTPAGHPRAQPKTARNSC